jgi:hypothetical protein
MAFITVGDVQMFYQALAVLRASPTGWEDPQTA